MSGLLHYLRKCEIVGNLLEENNFHIQRHLNFPVTVIFCFKDSLLEEKIKKALSACTV